MDAKGFTLVELLLVVVILGIIAGIVIPMFNSQIDDVKQSSLDANLEVIRKAIEIFYQDHRGVFPGYPNGDSARAPTEADFLNQMILKTARGGAVDSNGPCGPYMRADLGFPLNPLNGKNRVKVALEHSSLPGLNEEYGWVYSAATGFFQAVTGETGGAGQEEGEEEERKVMGSACPSD